MHETKIAGICMHLIYGSSSRYVCSANEGIFGMLTVISISRLPTLEMYWSIYSITQTLLFNNLQNNANFALQ